MMIITCIALIVSIATTTTTSAIGTIAIAAIVIAIVIVVIIIIIHSKAYILQQYVEGYLGLCIARHGLSLPAAPDQGYPQRMLSVWL